MAAMLPQEVLSSIAAYAAADNQKLAQYALSVLDPSQNTEIVVRENLKFKKRGLTLEQFRCVTDGPQSWCIARKKAVRKIFHRVAVPHWLNY